MDAFAGAIGVSDSNGKCSPEYIVCNPARKDVFNPYYGYLLREMALRGFIQASCPAVRERAPRIRFSDLKDMILPVPPFKEQMDIVEFINAQTKLIDGLQKVVTKTHELLIERRSILIATAISGQLQISA
jgi:type I restriction enzyme S subunit